ncbi:beta-glucanase [Streptomyces sp. NBC_01190]|uniref:beta-glucanase n=1 Tax=Streptomyces sp. NBC_01190 TaxID=2903767 RepID=UPI003863A3D8|nr:family 16 glycosylhydrolase [Streptomyces sp. NBC_01190]
MSDLPSAVVFDAPFSDRTAWAAGRTSAYPRNGRNPGDNKLDQIGPRFAPTPDGVFHARRAGTALWNTDLVSTEYAPGGFELLPGDQVSATCLVYATRGVWPALWTWGRDGAGGRPQPGHGEVDLFEYHPTNPRLLELTNHVRGAGDYAHDAITPGRPFLLSVLLGQDNVEWSVDGVPVFADHLGVGPRWRAWLIVCVSVSAGAYGHLPPERGVDELSWQCTGLTVRRPGAAAPAGQAGQAGREGQAGQAADPADGG